MAKIERTLNGDFYTVLREIHEGILGGSVSATFEDESCFDIPEGQVVTRVYERYSYMGGNRVSMAVTLVGTGGKIYLSAITSGGSQAMFFKLNTFGEEAFLDKLCEIVDRFE